MSSKDFITEVHLIPEDEHKPSSSDFNSELAVLTREDKPIGVLVEGTPIVPLLVAEFDIDHDLQQILNIVQFLLFMHPYVPGVVITTPAGQIEGIASRENIANEIEALEQRSESSNDAIQVGVELAGTPNVPLLIYCCPEGDYEFIPFQGEPDHLCPVHNLQLEPKEVVFDV